MISFYEIEKQKLLLSKQRCNFLNYFLISAISFISYDMTATISFIKQVYKPNWSRGYMRIKNVNKSANYPYM